MSRKNTSTVSTVKATSPVTIEQANVSNGRTGKAELGLCTLEHSQYGKVGVTLDSQFSTDAQGRTRSAYWLRFADASKAPTDELLANGWHTPDGDKRKGMWHLVNQAGEDTLVIMGVPESLLPKREPVKTPAPAPAPVKTPAPAPAKTVTPAPAKTAESCPLSYLSNHALAQMLEQVLEEIARRSAK